MHCGGDLLVFALLLARRPAPQYLEEQQSVETFSCLLQALVKVGWADRYSCLNYSFGELVGQSEVDQVSRSFEVKSTVFEQPRHCQLHWLNLDLRLRFAPEWS